jgi:hypothetical protein
VCEVDSDLVDGSEQQRREVLAQAGPLQAVGGTGDADGADGAVVLVGDWCADGVESLDGFLEVECVAALADRLQVGSEFFRVGDGVWRPRG